MCPDSGESIGDYLNWSGRRDWEYGYFDGGSPQRTGQRIESSLRKSETATVIDEELPARIYMYPSIVGEARI